MTTLTQNASTLELPDDFYWSDEAAWQPVVQSVERTITGALIIQNHSRIGGRPITLQPDSESASWITRQQLETLMQWAGVPGAVLQLNYRGRAFSVAWRHHDGQAIEAAPVVHFADVQTADFYTATLRFMEV